MPSICIMTMAFGRDLSEGRITDHAMLRGLEEAGFDGVELWDARLAERPGLQDEYKAYLADSSLDVPCLDVGCNFISRDPSARQQAQDALCRGIDTAVSFNSPVVLAAGSVLSGDITPEEGRAMITDGLAACLPAAQEAGVTLAIENFGVAPTLQCKASHCQEILDGAPGLAFVFDTGNFYFCGEEPLDTMEALAPHTCHVHLKDWIRSDTPVLADVAGTPLGSGLIPNPEIINRFDASHPVGWFSLEVTAPGEMMEAARHDLAAARSWAPA